MTAFLIVAFLRVEYTEDPYGIDETEPRLSWVLKSDQRRQSQSAYHVLVASSPELLERDEGDLWDSGKVASDQSVHIVYKGIPLVSRMRCWWKVRAWDQDDRPSEWSQPAQWTTGLLQASDWQAEWIGFDEPRAEEALRPEPISLEGNSWVSLPENAVGTSSPGNSRYFRGRVRIPDGSEMTLARIVLSSGHQFTLWVNGERAGESDGRFDAYRRPVELEITDLLVPGTNTFAVQVSRSHFDRAAVSGTNTVGQPVGQRQRDAAIIGKLRVDFESGPSHIVDVGTSWRATDTAQPDDAWVKPGFDDRAWRRATETWKPGERTWRKFITPDGRLPIPACPLLRRAFTLDKDIERATVYGTALGLYELRLNGARIGEDVLTPGWSDYNKRVYYQTYDVTDRVRSGENVVGVVLGHGWYSGYLGWNLASGLYGEHPRACIQLEVEFTDGTMVTIGTDSLWEAAHGPVVGSDLYMGEVYDARQERPGWDRPGYDDTGWQPVVVDGGVETLVEAFPGSPVRKVMELPPLSVSEPAPGVFVYDLGQNMVGWARLKVDGEAGRKVTLRFGEMLNPDGTLYVENLRGARCIDEYWLRGGGEEVWEPRFTFHGFRYVELTGYPGQPPLDAVTGVVVHSDMRPTGRFETSHALLNQLQSNIEWGQRGNFLEVPTDCPQRDERLGWMGDAQVFSRTACFNMDTAAFFTKWMQDVVDGQWPNGAFPLVAPNVAIAPFEAAPGPAAWGDAGVIIPWSMYLSYGDTRIIEEHYDAMKAFIAYMTKFSKDFIRPQSFLGDWLSLGKPTPADLISTAFYAYSTKLVAQMAAVIGRDDDAEQYEGLHEKIRAAFIDAYVDGEGHVAGDTQTGYVLALHFDLVPEDLRKKAAEHLVKSIEASDWHITTGFVGCPYITEALADSGHLDVAYRLLLNETYPSWLYSVTQGATTIWERWDGWRHDRGFQDPSMNSLNHYAYGAVGAWMYEDIAGIDVDPERPGYKHIIIRPRPGGGLTHAQGELDSMYGLIRCDWRIAGDHLVLNVQIPVNTTATVHVPAETAEEVTEGGVPTTQARGVAFQRVEDGAAVFEVGSGEYSFRSRWRAQ